MDKLLSGRRVLVVEHEMLVCMMIEDMLADLGCESVTAARKALDLIDARVFDAATLDMNLNGNDSHPIAESSSRTACPSYTLHRKQTSLYEGQLPRPASAKETVQV